jgi:hypothetical protein
MPRSLPLLALGAALLTAAPAAAADFPVKKRPHTRVATYVRHGVTVERLQASVRRAGARLRIAVDARVHNDLQLVKSVTLRAGRCTGTSLAFPACPDAVRLDVPVAPGRTVSVKRTITVAAPARSVDRVMITIAKHGALPRGLRGVYGQLLLDGHAWRGAGAGRVFGLDLTPDHSTSVQRMIVDAAAINNAEMRGAVAWTASSGDAVTLSTGLAGRALHPDIDVPAGGHASFLDRPYIKVTTRPSAFSALVQTGAGADLATVRLPWPS